MSLTIKNQNSKQSIPQSPTSRGKIFIQRLATILVVLSAILPFLNNIVRRFINTNSFIFENVAGARHLDMDDVIYFLSIPVAFILLAIGALCRAHKYSFYAVFVSCYFQLRFLLIFIFQDKNQNYENSQIALILIFITIAVVIYFVERYFRIVKLLDQKDTEILEDTLEYLEKEDNNDQ